ncbi:uncharacterized protein [Eleutherodactylus coqui]|uniref:uncharacterized protein n=1 Tax=Eleutherodactylus coqui TaxID=57060 RepID=UPI003461AC4C
MPQMKNVASFIRSHTDLAGVPVLVFILLILEKLMETEFVCPNNNPAFGIIYSLIFIFGTTAIVSIFLCFCPRCKLCGTPDEMDDLEQGPSSFQKCKDYTCCCCPFWHCFRCCPKTVYRVVKTWKVPIIWFVILVTDGRYWKCLVESIMADNVKATTEAKDFILQIIQVIGLLLILIAASFLCQCRTRSEMHRNIDLRPSDENPRE